MNTWQDKKIGRDSASFGAVLLCVIVVGGFDDLARQPELRDGGLHPEALRRVELTRQTIETKSPTPVTSIVRTTDTEQEKLNQKTTQSARKSAPR